MVSPGFFWLLVCMYRIMLLSEFSILPVFPGHAIFFDQEFPSRRFFTLSFLKDSGYFIAAKMQEKYIFCLLFCVGHVIFALYKGQFHILILFMLRWFYNTFPFRFINTRCNMEFFTFFFFFFFKEIRYYNITV
jgi:hypothetical protein